MSIRIAVYTMCKNEEAHVEQFCNSCEGADHVVVTDTGSTDKTVELLRARGVTVHEASIQPWRFDLASNVALCNVPANVDVCVKLDLDEVLVSAKGKHWRDCIEEVWVPGKTTQLMYLYTWSWIKRGVTPGVQFMGRHIHSRSGFVWRHAGHAALCITDDSSSKLCRSDKLEIHHYPDGSKKRPNYVKLLELAVEENECPRTLFYLGREYAFQCEYDKAIVTLQKYLLHKKSSWNQERAEAKRLIGICFSAQQNDTALKWFFDAINEYSGVREPWLALAEHYIAIKDYFAAISALTNCLKIYTRDSSYITNSAVAWTSRPHILLAKSLLALKNEEAMMTAVQRALQAYPDDRELIAFALSTGKFKEQVVE